MAEGKGGIGTGELDRPSYRMLNVPILSELAPAVSSGGRAEMERRRSTLDGIERE